MTHPFRKLTPRGRIALVTAVMALVWGAMIFCQGIRTPVHSADWALMSEVGRGLANGRTLYVDTMDQKGPLCYLTYALLWFAFHTPTAVFVASNVIIWAFLSWSSNIAARIVEEAGRPWAHLVAQVAFAAVMIVPHVGCIEEWLIPFGMLGLLWVRRLIDGEEVKALCWVVVGCAAAFALWSKFTCVAQFVFLLAYAAAHKGTRGLGKAAAIALGSCVLASAAVLLWVWLAGSFEGMLEHHIFAATSGYAERMSMPRYLETSSNPSSTHVSSFFVGLPVALLSLAFVMRRADRKLLALAGGAALMVCCFATFVGYYRFQLAPLAVLGVVEMPDPAWTMRPFRWVEALFRDHHLLYQLLSIAGIALAAYGTCAGTTGSVESAAKMRETLHEAVGDSKSVIVWQFNHTWAFAELGLEYPYVMPARYNASQDLWDETAGKDVYDQRWQYVIVVVNDPDIKEGTRVNVANTTFPVIARYSNMAVVDAGGGEDALTCEPYRCP